MFHKSEGVKNVTPEFLSMIKLPDSSGKNLNYLIVMPEQTDMRSQYMFPVGLGIVSSSLKASGRTVFTLNLTYKENPLELLREMIIKNDIDVVAVGGLSGQYALIREILDAAKSIRPNIISIVGGGIITAEPKVAMEALENADYGIFGEGEITINALAYALETDTDTTKVEGVISNIQGRYVAAAPRDEIMNLDCIPFPDYEGFDYIESFEKKYSGVGIIDNIGTAIITSRSCPYNCTFCFHSSGKKYRRRSLDNVFEEFDLLKQKFPIEYVYLADELFGNDISYLREFCKRIKPYGIRYRVSTRLDRVNDEMLGLLKDSGCDEILFGIEHVSEKILKSMQKNTSAALIEPVLNKVLEWGIRPLGNIIFGDLEETEETVDEAINWWRKHRLFSNITPTYLIVFPGSYVYKVACERGIINDPVQFLRDGCPLVNITTMSENKWLEMKDKIAKYRILYDNAAYESNEETLSKKLEDLIENYKVCVWPATHDIIRFFKSMSGTFCKSAYFVNRDTDSQMLRAADEGMNYKIYKPDVILSENLDLVICPRNSLKEEIRAICESNYPCVKHVIRIDEIENFWT